ncbi:hypothetical protein SAMN02949497_3918 [Methylomagnum ishizawai]|uniref:Uncharacterized protein n=1 Tax=Methylomagnum ishizawai TaxID=1760988 RepID=A0A1Y6D0R5_9GAMM|nr:hypothetical protein [Methylomagnum ishizawai]SMF96518.1 hypothetical protein SAMN02949497_3918 [Methylomagnum ishizawai]
MSLAPHAEPRFLLYHLQPISARLLFMRHASGSVLAPRPLPFLTNPIEDDPPQSKLDLIQQVTLGMRLNASLGFEPGMLVVEPDFLRRAEIPRAVVDLHLARFTSHDPPHEAARLKGAVFQPITELRGGHPVEMAMLRWAYEYLLAG